MASVKDAGFCHDAELDGVNLLRTCVESCDTPKHAHAHSHTHTKCCTLWALTVNLFLLCFLRIMYVLKGLSEKTF